MSVVSIQRGPALPVAALASASRCLSRAPLYRTVGLPVVFALVVTSVAAVQLRGEGVYHG